jgi:rhodanese-related sulfurtransferase
VVELITQQVKDISVDDLKKNMKAGKGLFILDVRELSSYCKGHIPGACDLFDAEIAGMKASDVDGNASIIVYGPGQSETSKDPMDRLSGDAIDKLKKAGFKNLVELKGGFQAWANAGNRVDSCDLKSIKPANVPLMGR